MGTIYFRRPKYTLIVFLFISAFCIHSNAQTVYYYYDNNGNRTEDFILEYSNRPMSRDTNKKDSLPCPIAVYPNPTSSGQVNVSIPCIQTCADAMIYISDASGDYLAVQKATSTLSPVSLSNYNQGTYYFKIVMCNQQYSYKVIKLVPGTGPPPKPIGPAKF